MLTGFRIRNFRSFVSADVSFQPQHLIVGRNNSGKTNLVRALRFLSATAGGDLASAAAWVPGGIAELPNWTLKTDRIELGCDCVLEIGAWEGTYSYDLELHVNRPTEVYPQAPLTLTVAKESLRAQGRDWKEPLQLISRNGSKATVLNPEPNGRCGKPEEVFPRPDATLLESLHQAQQSPVTASFKRFLEGIAYICLEPSQIRDGWRNSTGKSDPFLHHAGANLANLIFQLKNLDDLGYRHVLQLVSALEPELTSINYFPLPDQTAVPFVSMKHNNNVSWSALSDGTLRALALAYLAETSGWLRHKLPSGSAVCIIEEPENGIYPAYLRKVLDQFEERSRGAQIILTSQSPYVINQFDGRRDAVTILKAVNGRSEVVKPSQPSSEVDADRLTLAEELALELLG